MESNTTVSLQEIDMIEKMTWHMVALLAMVAILTLKVETLVGGMGWGLLILYRIEAILKLHQERLKAKRRADQ